MRVIEAFIRKYTEKDNAPIWHTDGARCYRKLKSHTSVKHAKKIWVARRKVPREDGTVVLCFGGTCMQDGVWAHLKAALPNTMHTYSEGDIKNLHLYAGAWAWRARRQHIPDLFEELGRAIARHAR